MVIGFSRTVMFFMVSMTARICLPAVGAHVPMSMMATVRFWRASALMSDSYASIFG